LIYLIHYLKKTHENNIDNLFLFIISGTYFSENALLPGLVKGEFNDKHVAKGLYDELKTEADRYPNNMPYSWISSKMRQIGLDVFSHEYSLNYPMGLGVVRKKIMFKLQLK